MEKVENLITEEQLTEAWGYANFGASVTKRQVLKDALLKCASGYHTGHTAKAICIELGLVTGNWTLTKLGKRYLYSAFCSAIDT